MVINDNKIMRVLLKLYYKRNGVMNKSGILIYIKLYYVVVID